MKEATHTVIWNGEFPKRSRHRTTVSRWYRARTCLTKLVCPWSGITQEYQLLKGHKLTGNEIYKAKRRNLAVIEGRISFFFRERGEDMHNNLCGNTCIFYPNYLSNKYEHLSPLSGCQYRELEMDTWVQEVNYWLARNIHYIQYVSK